MAAMKVAIVGTGALPRGVQAQDLLSRRILDVVWDETAAEKLARQLVPPVLDAIAAWPTGIPASELARDEHFTRRVLESAVYVHKGADNAAA
jgi:hypothetical protein